MPDDEEQVDVGLLAWQRLRVLLELRDAEPTPERKALLYQPIQDAMRDLFTACQERVDSS